MVKRQYPCQGQEGPWDKPPDLWPRQGDLCLPTTPVSGLRGRHLEPITQPGRGGTWVDGGHLTTGEGPLTQEGAQGSSSSCPAPHRKRCHGDREGDLAALQLECWVCACSWCSCAGQALPGLSPSCSLPGDRCGGDMGKLGSFSTGRMPYCLLGQRPPPVRGKPQAWPAGP